MTVYLTEEARAKVQSDGKHPDKSFLPEVKLRQSDSIKRLHKRKDIAIDCVSFQLLRPTSVITQTLLGAPYTTASRRVE